MNDAAALRSTYTQLEKLLGEFQDALQGIPDDDLNTWRPDASQTGGGEMNTLAAMCVHTVHAAGWRIVHQIYGQNYPRNRDQEFTATATRQEIDELFAGLLGTFTDLIESGGEVDLSSLPPTIRDSSPTWTRLDYLISTINHTALHVGHAQIHRQLWLAERAN